MPIPHAVRAFALPLCAALFAGPAQADTYPSKPLRLIVPYPAGGYFDLIGRSVGTRMGQLLHQTVVVENRPGANGVIGAQAVAVADPDGYTLLLGGIGPNATNVAMYNKLRYDLRKDFVRIIHIVNSPCILVVNPSLPVRSVADLLALVREKPGTIPYASAGVGSSQHLFGELFLSATQTRMMHVPYQGSNPSVAALLSGEVPVSFGIASDVIEHVRSGRLRALATTGEQRIQELPEVPTMKELGVPVVANGWFGLYAPAGTPPGIIETLHQQAHAALQDPSVRTRISAHGAAEVIAAGPQALQALQDAEIARWQRVAKENGISAQ
ncbi:Tripartite tricarboxylate transporter family receptor [Pigmentiphaga humi]|uniref:Tripartite tricarboxylate transporter family receptor n=1 Tax=Pigmentiphaga humi TaxID=2478468 RepID=A0A3P4B148_9BURK|nr:tripartite tricarboxylate transporter substrate binding protein [Pigmentiphaga humi]VCU69571.1 Tripartite tricarboxylate transporter family receptor [Pigmentiphaga humi]